MTEWRIEFYENRKGQRPVEEFLENLPAAKKARAIRLIDLLEELGTHLAGLYVKHIGGKIWELRSGSERIFYFLRTGRKFVLLHAITKKTRKTPRKAIRIAETRMRDYERKRKN